MHRRKFLCTASALLVPAFAGCGHPTAVLDMDEVTAESLARRQSTHGGSDEQDLVEAVVAGERPTVEGVAPPFDPDRPVVEDGRYYEFTTTVVAERTEHRYNIEVDYDAVDVTDSAVDYADLPSHDKGVLSGFFPPDEETLDNEGPDIGVAARYSDAEREVSVLVPDPEYDAVVYEGTAYPVAVGEERGITVTTYRYEATQIASSADEYAAQLRAQYLFTLSGLTDTEREVVEEAIDGGYYTDTEAFRSVATQFQMHEPLSGGGGYGDWLVKYRGEIYLAYLET